MKQKSPVIINHSRRIAKYGDYDCSTTTITTTNVRQSYCNDEHWSTMAKAAAFTETLKGRSNMNNERKNNEIKHRENWNGNYLPWHRNRYINIDSCQLHRDRNLILNKLIQYNGWLLCFMLKQRTPINMFDCVDNFSFSLNYTRIAYYICHELTVDWYIFVSCSTWWKFIVRAYMCLYVLNSFWDWIHFDVAWWICRQSILIRSNVFENVSKCNCNFRLKFCVYIVHIDVGTLLL